MWFLEKIDSFLNSITMYRLILYGLIVLTVIAVIFGFVGLLPFSGFQFLQSLLIILISCFAGNYLFSKITKADTNVESYWITALILFLVLSPIVNQTDIAVTAVISIVAMASKYFLTYDKKHIFNPAALGMFLAGLFGFGNAIWWAGSANLLPFVAIVGLLVVRKVRRFQLLFTFIMAAYLSIALFSFFNKLDVVTTLSQVLVSWPLVFFGTIMLTEPFTAPYNKKDRTIYGILVGFLFGAQFSFGPLYASPELALIVGNIYSFIVNPKGKLILKFKEKIAIAPTIYEFIFSHDNQFNFKAGQYLEWTLPHKKSDSRGVRRYFTIASSPQENEIKLGVKIIPDKSSSFKKALLNLNSGEKLTADQLAGDFTLPKNPGEKLVFVAGGIGVTPFRSMVKNLISKGERRDVVLFYSAATSQEFVYKEIFKKAEDFGVKTIYVFGGKEIPKNWTGESGYLTEEMIKRYAPDFKDRTFYLSGPVAMVNNYKKLLAGLGIPPIKIVTDYFPGF